MNPFKRVIDKFFELRNYYKDRHYEVMRLLNKILIYTLHGERIRKDIEEYVCLSSYWMMTENDERVKDYWSLGKGIFFAKLSQDEGREEDSNKKNVMLLHLGAFVSSNSKKNMQNFIEAINGF